MAGGAQGTRVLPRLGTDGTSLPPFASAADILAHPRFTQARDHYMQVMIDSHHTDPAIRHLMHEMARNVLFNIILGHHACRQDDDPATWPSVGMLRDIFLPFGLASARSFDEMLARLQVIGMIEVVADPHDRRRRLVVPTPRMIEEDLVWLANHMAPLAVLFPERDDYLPALQHDRAHQMAQRIVSTQNYAVAREVISPEDPVLALLLRQDAAKIVFIYLLAALQSPDGHRASVGYENAAMRLSTSRTHVRNLLADLQAFGLLEMHGRGGHDIEIAPRLWQVVDMFLANAMSGHDMVWQSARQMVSRPAAAA